MEMGLGNGQNMFALLLQSFFSQCFFQILQRYLGCNLQNLRSHYLLVINMSFKYSNTFVVYFIVHILFGHYFSRRVLGRNYGGGLQIKGIQSKEMVYSINKIKLKIQQRLCKQFEYSSTDFRMKILSISKSRILVSCEIQMTTSISS